MQIWKTGAVLCFATLLFAANSNANDTLLMQKLILRIDQLQVKQGNIFPAGSFPSYRLYALNKDQQKADINPFFTGLIALTLHDIRPFLTLSQQGVADHIITNALPVYDKFSNRKGRATYNFWPTDTPMVFPNAGWMNLFDKKQALPDDLDDTGIILLALQSPDSTVKKVHAIMQSYTNAGTGKVKNTFDSYKHIGAYSTWFGHKMPVDFDVCVLANVLYMVQCYNLSWTAADSASVALIAKVLEEKKHITAPSYVSPHYSRLPVILYHLSRLMAVKPIPILEQYRPQLISDAKNAFAASGNFLDQVLLSTSLMRWGEAPAGIKTHSASFINELIEDETFSFFIANIASMLPNPLKQWMGGSGVGKFYYYCPAYNNLLVLEYLAWRKRMGLSLP